MESLRPLLPEGFDLGELPEQAGDALGPHRGPVVHAPRAERPGPQGPALAAGRRR